MGEGVRECGDERLLARFITFSRGSPCLTHDS